jgi:hypothetical protein
MIFWVVILQYIVGGTDIIVEGVSSIPELSVTLTWKMEMMFPQNAGTTKTITGCHNPADHKQYLCYEKIMC